jgi:hypothetical protein
MTILSDLIKEVENLKREVAQLKTVSSNGWSKDYYLSAAAAANIDCTAIPQYARHLLVVASFRSIAAAATDTIYMTINGDAGANYGREYVNASAAVLSAGEASGAARVLLLSTGATATAGYFASCVLFIPEYANAAKNKNICTINGRATAFAVGNRLLYLAATDYQTLSAITRLTFVPASAANLAQYSRVTLYGLG